MKKKLLFLLFLMAFTIDAQEKLASSNGTIVFEASVPFFEPVKAQNEVVKCFLNSKRGTISFVVYIEQFSFEKSLMQEHFNKYYMESDKYPKATFKGLIEKFDLKNIAVAEKTYYINGKINLHGKSQSIRVPATIKKVPKGIEIISNFTLNADDYNIEIPYIIRSKISKNVKVSVKSIL
jgi:hypothetical protein